VRLPVGAVSLAIPNATIYVGAGTFHDHVTITPDLSGLTIEGAGMHPTTVTGTLTMQRHEVAFNAATGAPGVLGSVAVSMTWEAPPVPGTAG
jgi:hypothetical protein